MEFTEFYKSILKYGLSHIYAANTDPHKQCIFHAESLHFKACSKYLTLSYLYLYLHFFYSDYPQY